MKDLSKPLVVACIPAFNEERTIGGVVLRAMRHVDQVVVCNDGSKDLTGEIAVGLGAVVVKHERNKGYGAALRSSFKKALRLGADIIITLDGDGQHDPMEIPRLVERIVEGDVEIVIGSRFLVEGNSNAPIWRNAGIKLITDLASNKDLSVTDAQSGFRAYRKVSLESMILTEEGMGISTEILLKAGKLGFKIAEVPVNIRYDKESSTHNPVMHGIGVILSTVKYLSLRRPLRFYGVPGFLSLCIAAVFWAVAIRIFTTRGIISTNIALIALGATIVGLMLMTTSILLWVLISVFEEKSQRI